MASEITSRGAVLYDLLSTEVALREGRQAAIARRLDVDAIEASIRKFIGTVRSDLERLTATLETLATDRANLTAKIGKRQSELERVSKRLGSLKSVRPAFMDEYEVRRACVCMPRRHCDVCACVCVGVRKDAGESFNSLPGAFS